MTEAMPFLRKLITFLWPPDIWQGSFLIAAQRPGNHSSPFANWLLYRLA